MGEWPCENCLHLSAAVRNVKLDCVHCFRCSRVLEIFACEAHAAAVNVWGCALFFFVLSSLQVQSVVLRGSGQGFGGGGPGARWPIASVLWHPIPWHGMAWSRRPTAPRLWQGIRWGPGAVAYGRFSPLMHRCLSGIHWAKSF